MVTELDERGREVVGREVVLKLEVLELDERRSEVVLELDE